MSTKEHLSRLESEKRELQKDLVAFKSAYDLIRQRLLESQESDPHRGETLATWSGTWACIGSIDLTIAAIERQILEVTAHLEEALQNQDPPARAFFLVEDYDPLSRS